MYIVCVLFINQRNMSSTLPLKASNLQRPNVVAMTDDEYKAWEKDHFSKIQGMILYFCHHSVFIS